MRRTTLSAIRGRIEELATADGEFVVVCGRTGQQPVPVDGLAFPDRNSAAEAAQTAMSYRALLSDYDPQAPIYDFTVCQRDPSVETRPRTLVESTPDHQEGDA